MRSNALKRIRSNLINVPAVAFHPDHPLLLTGPDVLVGSEGLLFAFFVPTAHEFAHPNDLLARLTACRLVLPGHTFCAAVLDTETFSSELEHDFDKVIDKTDTHTVGRQLSLRKLLTYLEKLTLGPPKCSRRFASKLRRNTPLYLPGQKYAHPADHKE